MIDKTPSASLADLLTWAWVFGMSMLGGMASFSRKMRAGHVRAWNFTELVGELVVAALVGIITYNLCMWRDFTPQLTAALVGIASHMGSRALFKLEKFFDRTFPAEPPSEAP